MGLDSIPMHQWNASASGGAFARRQFSLAGHWLELLKMYQKKAAELGIPAGDHVLRSLTHSHTHALTQSSYPATRISIRSEMLRKCNWRRPPPRRKFRETSTLSQKPVSSATDQETPHAPLILPSITLSVATICERVRVPALARSIIEGAHRAPAWGEPLVTRVEDMAGHFSPTSPGRDGVHNATRESPIPFCTLACPP